MTPLTPRERRLAWGGFAAIVVLAFLLRWHYQVTAMVMDPVRGDAIQFFSYAWNVVHHHVFSMSRPDGDTIVADSFRDPGYPALMALWMFLTDDFDRWYQGVLMTQAVLGALTAGFAFVIARLCLSLRWAVLVGVLAAVWPHSLTAPQYLLSETLFGFFVTASVLGLAVAMRRGSRAWAVLAGLCFGLGVLVNPILAPLILLLPALLAWQRALPKAALGALVLSMAVLPLLWQVRNATTPGDASAGSRAKQNLVQGSWPEYHDWWRVSVGTEPDRPQVLPEEGREQRMAEARAAQAPMEAEEAAITRSLGEGLGLMVARFAQAPGRYLAWYAVRKPALLWAWDIRIGHGDVYINPTRNSPLDNEAPLRLLMALCRGLNPLVGLAALIGAVLAVRRRREGEAANVPLVVALVLVFVTLVHTVLQAEPRFATPYRSLEMFLAVTALAAFVSWYRARRAAGFGKEPA